MATQAAELRAERKRREVQQELADAAFDVFVERGYHATRVADITAHLGVGQSTFYKHFESKRAVVEHVLEQRLSAAMEAISSENAAGEADTLEDYLAQVERITAALFESLADDPRALRIMLFEAMSVDRELEDRWNTVLDLIRAVVAAYYRNGIDKAYFRGDVDVDASSDAVVGLLLGGLLRVLRDPADRDGYLRYVDAARDMVVSAAITPGVAVDRTGRR